MPTLAETLALAIEHHRAGRLYDAERIYQQILAIESKDANAWHLLGVTANELGKHESAVEYIQRALELGPGSAVAYYNLALTFHNQGKLAEAAHNYSRALQLNPDLAAAHNNLGLIHSDEGRQGDAIRCYHRALELKPNFAEACTNLGNVLKDQGNFDEAIHYYQRTLDLSPGYAEGHYNLGLAFQDAGVLHEAVIFYRRAIELRPDYVDAVKNLGTALQEQGKLDEAAACYDRALELDPNCVGARVNASTIKLLIGDFEHGWAEYEWRWKTGQFPVRQLSQPRWEGQPLNGRTILFHAEQGLGDTLQFIRYAALVKSQGATVVVECPRPLTKLLASCPGIDCLIAHGDELPPFDFHTPLLSLPGIFKTRLDTIPARMPYLFADRALVAEWQGKLRDVTGYRIGINWQGRTGKGPFRRRDIPLECFASLAQLPEVRLFSLQKPAAPQQGTGASDRLPIVDVGDDLDVSHGRFMDTAAIMMNLDLVVTSDTSIPHLAGALGVPVWLALPYVPDWRWLLDRSDSPWYPTMRLFRQPAAGDWQSVFQEITTALRGLIQSQ